MSSLIELKNLTKVYETVNYNIIALSDVNYKLDKGEVVVLLGKSGSGKSTLLNILGGFDREYAGYYHMDGESMHSKSERDIDKIRKRRIGFVFQHYVLLDNLTVLENVELSLKVIGVVSEKSRRRGAMHALKLVGLRDHVDKFPSELSGGQRQRVAIARAFVKNPDIIIADEPTAALDSRTSKEVLDILVNLCRNKLLIIATHNKSIVRDYGTRVIELKSGYTLRNDLITDRSDIEVDELDEVIDAEMDLLSKKEKAIEQVEKNVATEQESRVLEDLGVDLEGFKKNVENKHQIDQELKLELIRERQQNTKLNTRIYRFLQTSDDFIGKKMYALKSFVRNIGLHLFSAFIFAVFMLTIVFGFNFCSEIFSGFNEKAMYTRDMGSESVVLFVDDQYVMAEGDDDLYHDLEDNFIKFFNQTNVENSNFLDNLLLDPYYRYQYDQDLIMYLDNWFIENDLEDSYGVYYNNTTIIEEDTNEDIVFSELRSTYKSIFENPQPLTYVSSFLDVELTSNLYHQYTYVYAENNQKTLEEHLVTGSSLPKNDGEIVIPISYLFDHEIVSPEMFRDEETNDVSQLISSADVFNYYMSLPEAKRKIELTTSVVTVVDDGDTYDYSISTTEHEFTVVGLLNLDDDINPNLTLNEDTYIEGASSESFSFVISKEATEYVNYQIINSSNNVTLDKTIQYIEIDRDVYEKNNLDAVIEEFSTTYQETVEAEMVTYFTAWIETLQEASVELGKYVDAEMASSSYGGIDLDDVIDDELFAGLSYRELLYTYVAQHVYVIYDEVEFAYLCPGCNESDRDFDAIYLNAGSVYTNLLASEEYNDVLENIDAFELLTFQEASNRIIYSYYGDVFNNQFYQSSLDEDYEVLLHSSFTKEYTNILQLINTLVPVTFQMILPGYESIQESISNLQESEGFIHFLETTNMDLIITSFNTNAIRSVVLSVLYVTIYLILLLGVIMLCFVLINLYGNIYETSTRKRTRELASLRVLGTSYDDIKQMIVIENRIVAVTSYSLFFILLFLMNKLELFTGMQMKLFYLPKLKLLFNFNVYDIFAFRFVVILFVSVLFYFYIYRFVIRRVSMKKTRNIDTIRAIKDGDSYD